MSGAQAKVRAVEAPDRPALRRESAGKSMLRAGLGEAMRRFEAPGLVEGGHVGLISLEAVAEAQGAGWSRQAGEVASYLEGLLTRELVQPGFFLQVSSTDVLICLPDRDRREVQASCQRILGEVLQHVVGGQASAAEHVYEVNAIRGDRIEAQRLSKVRLAALAETAPRPVVASDGRRLVVDCRLDPLVNLQTTAPIGLRLTACVTAANGGALAAGDLRDLAAADRRRIEQATIECGLAQLRGRPVPPPSVLVTVSCASVADERTRARTLDLLQQARRSAAHGAICELSGVEDAAPAKLREALAILRPLSLFVVGKIDFPPLVVWRQLKGLGLRGLAFDCPPFEGDAVFLGWARELFAKARPVASSVLLYGVPSNAFAARLRRMGASHATFCG